VQGSPHVPDGLHALPTTRATLAYARRVHAGQRRSVDGAPFIAHPLEVAGLLSDIGAPQHVIAADKISKIRELELEPDTTREPRRLAHYRSCLMLLEEHLPHAPLVQQNIVFALLYWEIDGGGSAARARHAPEHPDLAFPQQMSPDLAPAGWRPVFIDYLYLGFTNALAFSPTDAMPLVPWAKISMLMQSLVSVAILGLVIARAVNVLT
jgi:hypothetical protein